MRGREFMEFTFENQGTHTYLVYAVKPEDTVDTMSLGMLTNNKIPGLAAVQFTQKDAEKFIKYNISARVSVRQFLEGVVNRQRLVGVLQGIVTGLRSSREYMIDPKSVVMDLDYMFVDVSTYQTALVCLPLMNVEDNQVDLGMLLKDIVFHTQFDQTENGDYIAKLLNYLNKPTPFSLDEFGDVLDGIGQGGLAGSGPAGMSQAPAPAAPVQPSAAPAPAPAQTPAPVAAPQAVEPPATPAYTYQGKKAAKKPLVRGDAPVPPKAAPVPPKGTPMAAPVPPKAGKEKEPNAQPQQTQEKEISFFYLMQHYNKENAAAYKAQKQAKKEAKQAGGKEKAPKKAKDKGVPPVGMGYAVPGQSAPQAAPGPAAVPASAPVAAPTAPNPGPAPTAAPAPQPVAAPQPVQPTSPQPRPTMNFGETTVLMGGAAGETTVLGVGPGMTPATQPHLIRRKNNEKIPINKPVFRIGKERSYVDYFIGDNTAISRSHANFIIREGQYSVVDTNSTNHTFVNGTMVPSNQEVVVSHGDVIRLANEDFEFRLY